MLQIFKVFWKYFFQLPLTSQVKQAEVGLAILNLVNKKNGYCPIEQERFFGLFQSYGRRMPFESVQFNGIHLLIKTREIAGKNVELIL